MKMRLLFLETNIITDLDLLEIILEYLFLKMIMSDTNISSSYIARTTYYKNVDTVFMLMI